MNKKGIIYGINGPVIYLKGNTGLRMSEMVHVGEEHLVGDDGEFSDPQAA